MALFEIKHRFTGEVLFKLETESLRLCVDAAVKGGANLGGANLVGAYLGGVAAVIALGAPNVWHAHAWLRDGWLSIRVGCQEKRLDEARAYWTGKNNRREVMAALDYAETVAVLRGWSITAPDVGVAA